MWQNENQNLEAKLTIVIDVDPSNINFSCSVIPRIGDRFYCNHCKETVSKSTFYEHQTLYGDSACGFSGENVEVELDEDSDSENEGTIPCWDDEDRQFFSEGDSSDDDDKDVDDEMAPVKSLVEGHESSMQSGQQVLVSLSNSTVSKRH